MSRLITLPFLSRRKTPVHPVKVDAVVVVPVAGAARIPAAEPAPRHRVGLWVLSVFVVVAALVVTAALVVGPQKPGLVLMIPLALFWIIAVCAGFALRSALMNIARTLLPRRDEKPDVATERLARMVRAERKREARLLSELGLPQTA
jgi:hypothetical protein